MGPQSLALSRGLGVITGIAFAPRLLLKHNVLFLLSPSGIAEAIMALTQTKAQEKPREPISLKWRASKAFNIFVVSFAVGTDMFLYDLILPVIPTALHDRVGLTLGTEQRWTSILMASYGASMVVFSIISGYLGDRMPRKWPFIAGLVVLGLGTALLCVGTNIILWIVGRVCQGGAAAVVWTVGVALLADNFPDALGQALGYSSMAAMAGTTLGPLLGGILYEHCGYYAPFGLAFGLIALDFVFRMAMIERRHWARWCVEEEPRTAPTEVEKLDDGTLLTVQCPNDAPSTAPRTPPASGHALYWRLLRSPRLVLIVSIYLLTSMTMTSLDTILALFVRDTFAWAQSGQGLIFLPLVIPRVMDPLIGYLVDRWPNSRRWLAAGALLGVTPALVCMRYVTENGLGDKVLLCSLLGLLGLFMAMFETPILVETFSLVQQEEILATGVAGGTTALVFGISHGAFAAGGLIGPFFGGFVRDAYGWSTVTWVLALPTGLSAILLLVVFG